MTATPAPAALALDLVLGQRGATDCGRCGKHLPALDTPRFEVEDAAGVLCMVCCDKTHRGLRIAALLLNVSLDLEDAGDKQASREALQAVVNGVEMILEDAPRPRYVRPVRRQPAGRRRKRR